MTLYEASRYFGSQAKLARALGIKPPSVCLWRDRIPAERQKQIEKLTGGELKADVVSDVPCVPVGSGN